MASDIGKKQRGLLIVFEGLDRSGKTTQVGMLYDKFKSEGREVTRRSALDRTTPTGVVIDGHLKSRDSKYSPQELHSLFTINRQEQIPTITSLLSNGTTVIMDRYAYSGVAYSVRDVSIDAFSVSFLLIVLSDSIWRVFLKKGLSFNERMTAENGLPIPDIIFFMDITPEAASKREGYGEERFEDVNIQKEIRWIFYDLLYEPSWAVKKAITL
jgi:dTMP kinase